MDIKAISDYFFQYGTIAIFVIVFLEYLNLPGLPSGIIMPLAGMWASKGRIGFGTVLTLSVIAGIFGIWLLYFVGRFGGQLILKKYVESLLREKLL